MKSIKNNIIQEKRKKRLGQTVPEKEKTLTIQNLQKEDLKIPTKIKANIVAIKATKKASIKEKESQVKTNKESKKIKEKNILDKKKKEITIKQQEINILQEYKNYIDQFKIKNTSAHELKLLRKLRPIYLKEGLKNTLRKLAKERGIKVRELFLKFRSVLNNAPIFLKREDLNDLSVFEVELINIIKNINDK